MTPPMQPVNFEEGLELILHKDPRYHRDAYLFLREALDYTQKMVAKSTKEKIRHVSGQELLQGIRAFGMEQFGPMTLTVFNEWGIHRCEDFGELVFNMVEQHLLAKTREDSRADFQGGYDFEDAFRRPFLPSHQTQSPEPKTQSNEV